MDRFSASFFDGAAEGAAREAQAVTMAGIALQGRASQLRIASERLAALEGMHAALLEALELARDWLVSTGADGSPLPTIDSALARARGAQ